MAKPKLHKILSFFGSLKIQNVELSLTWRGLGCGYIYVFKRGIEN